MLNFQCHHCSNKYTSNDDWAGREFDCQICGNQVIVPQLSSFEVQNLNDDVSPEAVAEVKDPDILTTDSGFTSFVYRPKEDGEPARPVKSAPVATVVTTSNATQTASKPSAQKPVKAAVKKPTTSTTSVKPVIRNKPAVKNEIESVNDWDIDELIDDIFEDEEPVQRKPKAKKKSQKNKQPPFNAHRIAALIRGFVVIVALSFGGYFGYHAVMDRYFYSSVEKSESDWANFNPANWNLFGDRWQKIEIPETPLYVSLPAHFNHSVKGEEQEWRGTSGNSHYRVAFLSRFKMTVDLLSPQVGPEIRDFLLSQIKNAPETPLKFEINSNEYTAMCKVQSLETHNNLTYFKYSGTTIINNKDSRITCYGAMTPYGMLVLSYIGEQGSEFDQDCAKFLKSAGSSKPLEFQHIMKSRNDPQAQEALRQLFPSITRPQNNSQIPAESDASRRNFAPVTPRNVPSNKPPSF
jgi:DNA-directed RNA polymerase subunit RPC12/RpoP